MKKNKSESKKRISSRWNGGVGGGGGVGQDINIESKLDVKIYII